jgi:hypothetical protein
MRMDTPVESALVTTLADGTKVKRQLPHQRACNEKDDKGKLCAGHLKRWYFHPEELGRQFGGEIYRCEHCKTLYLPETEIAPRTLTLRF